LFVSYSRSNVTQLGQVSAIDRQETSVEFNHVKTSSQYVIRDCFQSVELKSDTRLERKS